jgi:hypothetical protein
MVSLRDERDSLNALSTHSQACLLHPWVFPLESGSPHIWKRAAFCGETRAEWYYQRPLRESIAPDPACNSTEQHCAGRDGAR